MVRHKEFDPADALTSAMRLFWEKGYDATSVQDIVERLGIGRRSLYDTFGDKHALFVQSLRLCAHMQEQSMRGIVNRTTNAREGVRVLLGAAVSHSALGTGCFVVNSATEVASRDDEAAARIEQHFAFSREVLAGLVHSGQREGSITSPAEPAVLAGMLFNAWPGLCVGARAGMSPQGLREDLDNVLGVLDRV